jgi:F-type H+-transporting ATPase subunit delta
MKKTETKPENIISGLMDYLSETGEEHLLQGVSSELDEIVQKSKKAEVIVVSSVVSLTDADKGKIEKYINGLLGIKLPVSNIVDKTLIGGFTIKVGDWFLDASLQYDLKNIKQTLLD